MVNLQPGDTPVRAREHATLIAFRTGRTRVPWTDRCEPACTVLAQISREPCCGRSAHGGGRVRGGVLGYTLDPPPLSLLI